VGKGSCSWHPTYELVKVLENKQKTPFCAVFEFLAVPMGMLRHLAKSPFVKTSGDRHTSVCLFAAVKFK
jgi:hypothetical protein